MADRDRPQLHPLDAMKGMLPDNYRGPSTSQALTVATMVPVGGLLLTAAGITLTISVIALLLLAPLFILFSPVIVPAAVVLAMAVAGFLFSLALGLSGVSSVGCVVRQIAQHAPEKVEHTKRKIAEKTKEGQSRQI